MKRVAIVGGGFAGLAAGVALAERGFAVTVLEARPHLGGRAYSFRDEASGTVVDNGQHALMGCYRETLGFLARIGAGPKLFRQRNLRVEMIDVRRGAGTIACPALPGPLHMLGGVLGYRLLSRPERLAALVGGLRLLALRRRRDPRLASSTVAALLADLGQSPNACESFWHPVAIATLNERPERAAAGPFVEVLARAFFRRRADSEFVLPAVGLSELYADDARRHIERLGGRVECRTTVAGLALAGDRVVGLHRRNGDTVPADAAIGAVPPRALAPLLPPALRTGRLETLDALETAPIVSTHMWWDRPVLAAPFVGLLGTPTQWLFDRTRLLGGDGRGPQCVSAVISGDRGVAAWAPARIEAAVADDVRAALPAARGARLVRAVVVKEKHATMAPTPAAMRLRPGPETAIDNFVLAGDWTDTGLPATIESAVLSGHRAAAMVARRLGGEACDFRST